MAIILVISPTPSHPQDAGNRARIFSLLAGLKAAGHQVHFAFVRMEQGDQAAMEAAWDGFYPIPYRRPRNTWQKRYYDRLAAMVGSKQVLPFGVDDWYPPKLSALLREIGQKLQPDMVLVEYVYLSKAFECFDGGCQKALDTHDLFGDRHKLYIEKGLPPVFFYTSPQQEQQALNRADLVMAIQNQEAAYFDPLTSAQVLTVGHLVPPQKLPAIAVVGEAPRLLFVGSRNHINLDGINWFFDEVLPLLQEKRPTVQLDVVGGCTSMLEERNGANLIGPVEELLPYYAQATLVINPIRFGTGLKIKTIEAMAMNRPLVTTSIGAAGLDGWQERAFLQADSPTAFVDAIVRLLDSAQLRQSLCEQASSFVESYNRTAIQPLLSAIRNWETTDANP
jgi:glycosyltransferase involved in cell wall biosynthesis